MKYNILSTGSHGNCIIIEDNIMLDCGISYSRIKKYLNKIRLIFISHRHTDHCLPTCIKQIAYNYPTIKFVCNIDDRVLISILAENGVSPKNILAIPQDKWYDFNICKIKLQELHHDVKNSLCKLEIRDKKIVYITDTSSVRGIEAKNYDYYLIENNYNEEILKRHLEKANENEMFYLKRTMATHLSKSACDEFLMNNMGDNSKYEYIHLSKYNNTNDGNYEIRNNIGDNYDGNMETNR